MAINAPGASPATDSYRFAAEERIANIAADDGDGFPNVFIQELDQAPIVSTVVMNHCTNDSSRLHQAFCQMASDKPPAPVTSTRLFTQKLIVSLPIAYYVLSRYNHSPESIREHRENT